MSILISASSVLSLLDENDLELKEYALNELNSHIEEFWPEIATSLNKIESFYDQYSEQDSITQTQKQEHDATVSTSSSSSASYSFTSSSSSLDHSSSHYLAAIVASQVFYHLDELDDALKYALGAGPLFDVNSNSQYVQTLTSKCIDEYIKQRNVIYQQTHHHLNSSASVSASASSSSASGNTYASHSSSSVSKPATIPSVDSRLSDIVERMFIRCYQEGQFHQALGIAIESKRLDQVRIAVQQSHDSQSLLQYAYQLSQTLVLSNTFKRELLGSLIELYETQSQPDYPSMCQCLLFLNQSKKVASILNSLVSTSSASAPSSSSSSLPSNVDIDLPLLAYQIAFDLSENENQFFLNEVSSSLPVIEDETMSTSPSTSSLPLPFTSTAASVAEELVNKPLSSTNTYASRLRCLRLILSGTVGTELQLQFLFEKNATDLNILKHIKDKLEQRNTVTHNATVITHALMHCGTTIDVFLRDNLEWLAKAQNWAKFTATASIGVIHKGHIQESRKLLEPYLPHASSSSSPYQEGGALYALGLVHQSHGTSQIEYLHDALKNANNNEIVQHGAALGLGLCAIATCHQDVYETLKGVVMSESAVAGEAAAYSMGLIMFGSGNGVVVEEMLAYAHDTTHEKIIRGLAMGISMIYYNREEEADIMIQQLLQDKDPILRYGAMYTIALAYACTSNNIAVQKLLHVAVSDVSDDVRRAAVTCLGFVLANVPEQVPRVVALLAESYTPHVRHGAALAVGIARAAGPTAIIRQEALAVLEPLLKDRVDFVRQGAFIGLSMVLIQHNTETEPKVAILRKSINDAMAVKSDTMTKFGAILSAGILDAGGRNVTISLLSNSGHKKQQTIIGLAMFPQFWFWYPLVHFISLAFTPTACIALNHELEMPADFLVLSKAPKKLFDYPAALDLSKKEDKKEVKHATLSITAKVQAKQKRRENEEKKDKGSSSEDANSNTDVNAQTLSSSTPTQNADLNSVTKSSELTSSTFTTSITESSESESAPMKDVKAAHSDVPIKETNVDLENLPFHVLHNPARVTLAQRSTLICPRAQRYSPVKKHLTGFVLLKDSQPNDPVMLVKTQKRKFGAFINEPQPPSPFIYHP